MEVWKHSTTGNLCRSSLILSLINGKVTHCPVECPQSDAPWDSTSIKYWCIFHGWWHVQFNSECSVWHYPFTCIAPKTPWQKPGIPWTLAWDSLVPSWGVVSPASNASLRDTVWPQRFLWVPYLESIPHRSLIQSCAWFLTPILVRYKSRLIAGTVQNSLIWNKQF